jgi:hypothetical protein
MAIASRAGRGNAAIDTEKGPACPYDAATNPEKPHKGHAGPDRFFVQGRATAVHHDTALLHDVVVVGQPHRNLDILLDQQHRHLPGFLQGPQHIAAQKITFPRG